MDTTLQARIIRQFGWRACLALVLTTIVWILAGCDTHSAISTVSRGTVTSDVEPSHAVRLTEYNFDRHILNSTRPVLVDFWASWCTPCLNMAPVIKQLADDFEGRAVVGKVDIDAQPEIAERFRIERIPVVLVFQNGQLVDRLEGASSKAELAHRLTMLLEPRSVSASQSRAE